MSGEDGRPEETVEDPRSATPESTLPFPDGGDVATHPTGNHPDRPFEWVGDWSARRAQLSPQRVGLIDRSTGRRFTYRELEQRANRTARLLKNEGVEQGDRIVTVSRNRPELVDLFFATGKLGAVLAPVSHRLAAPELVALCNDIDPALVIAEPRFDELTTSLFTHHRRTFAATGLTIESAGDAEGVLSDWRSLPETLPAEDTRVAGPTLAPSDPHLFLHTGGSTGTPKEVVIPHGSIVWNSMNTITAWGLRPDDITPMVFPMFHTGGWNVITVPLFHMGGTVIIAREFDPGDILETIGNEGATVLVAVPAQLRMMTEHDAWAETDLSSLRFVKSGGGPARESVLAAWWDRDIDLSQGYGLTECGPNNFAMPDDWPASKADTVGIPALHVDVRIVDDSGQPVPVGEVGELELAGPHAADRYWRNPEESAETFDGWVSTGDLAVIDEDGYVSIEGRKKNMFVSGGENVYPPEVEDAIADHPHVADVIVVPIPDEQWGQVGKAVIELATDVDEGDHLSIDDLRSFLDGRLARFKHPRRLAFVDELPTSGPSKIDREAVAREYGEAAEDSDGDRGAS